MDTGICGHNFSWGTLTDRIGFSTDPNWLQWCTLEAFSFDYGGRDSTLICFGKIFLNILNGENVKKVWKFGLITIGLILRNQTLFEILNLFVDFIFQVSVLLIEYLV